MHSSNPKSAHPRPKRAALDNLFARRKRHDRQARIDRATRFEDTREALALLLGKGVRLA